MKRSNQTHDREMYGVCDQ